MATRTVHVRATARHRSFDRTIRTGATVGSKRLGNQRVIGTPAEELARGARNARMAQVRASARSKKTRPGSSSRKVRRAR